MLVVVVALMLAVAKAVVRVTVGSNHMDFPGNKNTPMADLTTAKLLISSTISAPGAKFLGINLASFYPPCQAPNTCVSILTSSPTKSSSITTFVTLSLLTVT